MGEWLSSSWDHMMQLEILLEGDVNYFVSDKYYNIWGKELLLGVDAWFRTWTVRKLLGLVALESTPSARLPEKIIKGLPAQLSAECLHKADSNRKTFQNLYFDLWASAGIPINCAKFKCLLAHRVLVEPFLFSEQEAICDSETGLIWGQSNAPTSSQEFSQHLLTE